MKLAPDDPRVRTNLGMTLAAAGKTQEALPLLSGNQGDAIGHANLGYLLAATGQYELARQEYQAALAMRPDLDLARRALAQLDRQEKGTRRDADDPGRPQHHGRCPDPSIPQVKPASATAADDEILAAVANCRRCRPSRRRSCPVAPCPGNEVGMRVLDLAR